VHLLGPLTAEALLAALYDGLRLAAILACVGAAASLASPSRLLATLPTAAYEAGVAVVVATTFTPLLVEDLGRIRQARRLRGRPTSGITALRATVVPVLEGALERSITLAAAMDSRGYGRRAPTSPRRRALTTSLVLGGVLATAVGTYGVLAAGTPTPLGVPLLIAGLLTCLTGVVIAGRRVQRTRYRPERWTPRSLLVAASGLAAGLLLVLLAGDPGLVGPISPPQWPGLSPLAAAALLLPALPALVAGARP
jgi:energy-coupling factor transport system permease protein